MVDGRTMKRNMYEGKVCVSLPLGDTHPWRLVPKEMAPPFRSYRGANELKLFELCQGR